MLLKRIVILLGIVTWNLNTVGQTNCPDTATYLTSKVSFGENSFPTDQIFIIKKDSLRVTRKLKDPSKPLDDDMIFYILERKCDLNEDLSIGTINFELAITDEDKEVEYANLRIQVDKNGGKIILRYEGEEDRVFELTAIK